MEKAAPVRRDIQQEHGVSAHGTLIDADQFVQGTHLRVLLLVVKPAWADGGIYLRGVPDQLRFRGKQFPAAQVPILGANGALAEGVVVALLAVLRDLFRIHGAPGNHVPLRFPGVASLIAAPADVRPTDRNAGVRLQPADGLVVARPVVVLLFAIGALAAGTVKPYAEDVPVLGQQLRQLGYKVIVIGLALAVQRAVPVPGGEIDAKAYTTPAAGIRHFRITSPLPARKGLRATVWLVY